MGIYYFTPSNLCYLLTLLTYFSPQLLQASSAAVLEADVSTYIRTKDRGDRIKRRHSAGLTPGSSAQQYTS